MIYKGFDPVLAELLAASDEAAEDPPFAYQLPLAVIGLALGLVALFSFA